MTKNTTNPNKVQKYKLAIVRAVITAIIVFIALVVSNSATNKNEGYSGPDSRIERGVTTEGLPFLGSAAAPVTLVEYEDFGCSNCRRFMIEVEPLLIEEFIKTGKVRLIIYTMAYVSQTQSVPAAEGAACAADQGMFWEYRHLLFANLGSIAFSRSNIIRMAENVDGLDVGEFSTCYDSQQFRAEVKARTEAGLQIGVTGTPTIELGGVRFPGLHPYDSMRTEAPGLKQLIEAYINKE